jgi:predicted nucleic acid-binding protein
LIESLSVDTERIAELVETYDDLPLGTVDASVIALAERRNLDTVVTLDRRDFGIVRPAHRFTLTLLP